MPNDEAVALYKGTSSALFLLFFLFFSNSFHPSTPSSPTPLKHARVPSLETKHLKESYTWTDSGFPPFFLFPSFWLASPPLFFYAVFQNRIEGGGQFIGAERVRRTEGQGV